MFAGQLALTAASVFLGCAVYMTLVEQSARLRLDDQALLKEWQPSDHRSFPLLAISALVAAVLALLAYFSRQDLRWMIGAFIIIMTWPYWFFAVEPMSARLLAAPPGAEARQLIRYVGLMDVGLCALGAVAVAVFLWALN